MLSYHMNVNTEEYAGAVFWSCARLYVGPRSFGLTRNIGSIVHMTIYVKSLYECWLLWCVKVDIGSSSYMYWGLPVAQTTRSMLLLSCCQLF